MDKATKSPHLVMKYFLLVWGYDYLSLATKEQSLVGGGGGGGVKVAFC